MDEQQEEATLYFVWQSEAMFRGGVQVRAEFRPFSDDWFMVALDMSCEPLWPRLPAALEYDLIWDGQDLPDHLWSASGLQPCSPGLVELVREMNAEFETIPARFYDRRTGAVVRDDYQYLHVMGCSQAVDFDHTRAEVRTGKNGKAFLGAIERLVLREDFVSNGPPLFRLAEARTLVLASETFKRAYEDRNLRGSKFKPLESYQVK